MLQPAAAGLEQQRADKRRWRNLFWAAATGAVLVVAAFLTGPAPATGWVQTGYGILVFLCLAVFRGAVHFGLANAVTMVRALAAAWLSGLVFTVDPAAEMARFGWVPVVITISALCLDGVDGWVARRFGQASRFGARLDMETDAFLILVLSVVVWRAGIAGPWVLFVGGMRYAFLAAGLFWPILRDALPPSRRRQTVCVIQVLALTVALVPPLPETVVTAVLAFALATLSWSFGLDIRHLVTTTERTDGSPNGQRKGEWK